MFVKVRRKGSKRFMFMTPRGGMNPLRVHASIFADREQAEAFIAENGPRNPEYEFRVQS